MPIKVGDRLPSAKLFEFIEEEKEGCSIGPNPIDLTTEIAGKTVVIVAVPGAFTPTCSAKHLPGFVEHYEALIAQGIDEVWCLSVNDAFVMGMWGMLSGVGKKVRMIADGSAQLTQKLGVGLDLIDRGMGIRSQRYSMLVKNGIVELFNLESPGAFEVSSAQTMLKQLGTKS